MGEIAALRAKRLEQEAEQRKLEIAENIECIEKEEKVRIEKVDAFVRQEAKEIKNMIKQEDVVKAIEEALANPVDYEFAIDTEGHIFRGRTTKSSKVPRENREKLTMKSKGRLSIIFHL